MVPDDARKSFATGSELVSSFQVLELVGEALQLVHEGADRPEVTKALTAIRARFERCETTLERLPGGALTRREQLAEIRRLGEELGRKQRLVQKYAANELIARVGKGKEIPVDEEEAMEDDAGDVSEEEEEEEDVLMKMDDDGFDDVEGMDKEVEEDVLMGLDI